MSKTKEVIDRMHVEGYIDARETGGELVFQSGEYDVYLETGIGPRGVRIDGKLITWEELEQIRRELK